MFKVTILYASGVLVWIRLEALKKGNWRIIYWLLLSWEVSDLRKVWFILDTYNIIKYIQIKMFLQCYKITMSTGLGLRRTYSAHTWQTLELQRWNLQ